ncbi:MAG: hypothetical protein PHP69_04785 [Candidatus Omnitrophica bacterium]|jgi:hypothetical protein|nr:hypothetical protein [Candidatus Omnitrophota bacterium]MDD5080405.1 hypothetical protein [Candidatus Omnitrophota bacterium]MDD5440709.1 hypothetical protein [Candidatus Omnitrophota bacterium]
MKLSRYIKPEITVVELDQEQAILTVCRAGDGIWMDLTFACVISHSIIRTWPCNNGFKGTGTTRGIDATGVNPELPGS